MNIVNHATLIILFGFLGAISSFLVKARLSDIMIFLRSKPCQEDFELLSKKTEFFSQKIDFHFIGAFETLYPRRK